MFATFALLATVYLPGHPMADVYVLDYAMTGQDCLARLEQATVSEEELQEWAGSPIEDAILSCELDTGFGEDIGADADPVNFKTGKGM